MAKSQTKTFALNRYKTLLNEWLDAYPMGLTSGSRVPDDHRALAIELVSFGFQCGEKGNEIYTAMGIGKTTVQRWRREKLQADEGFDAASEEMESLDEQLVDVYNQNTGEFVAVSRSEVDARKAEFLREFEFNAAKESTITANKDDPKWKFDIKAGSMHVSDSIPMFLCLRVCVSVCLCLSLRVCVSLCLCV